jgi:hypothetical protein
VIEVARDTPQGSVLLGPARSPCADEVIEDDILVRHDRIAAIGHAGH